MDSKLFLQKHENIVEKFVSNRTFQDSHFKIILELACITASTQIHDAHLGMPARASFLDSERSHYWLQWDYGRDLVDVLVILCRQHGMHSKVSHLWKLIAPSYQYLYNENWEFGREVTIATDDMNGLIESLGKNNKVSIGDILLTPELESVESDDDYGQPTMLIPWQLKIKDGMSITL
ncbi:MAG: hypothetical protein HAW67_04930, partial [Endozoicomonadaceae bacterium]|nr:hypothetical protein [Endozoicomonadaceae bacterium]